MFKTIIQNIFEAPKSKFAFVLLLVFSISYLLISDSDQKTIELKPAEPLNTSFSYFSQTEDYKYIISLQNSFIRIAKSVKPAVIHLSTLYQDTKVQSKFNPFKEEFSLKNLQKFFDGMFKQKQFRIKSLGSGIIFSKNGYILTNYHVIENAERLLVQLSDNREFEGTLVGADEKTDLAVIKIKAFDSLPTAPLGDSQKLQVGEWVMAIGNPYGLDRTVTVGIISAKGRSDIGITTFENFIQTDASINPGNSGGPLLNLEGEVIGINTAIIAPGSGIGFAIPINMAKLISDKLIETGKVERGWIGAGIQPLTPELARTFKTTIKKGVLVNKIVTKAPASKGGLKQGDIIVMFDGNSIASPKELQKMVAFSKIGRTVKVKVSRNGAYKTIKIKIEKMKS